MVEEDKDESFASVIKGQIKELRKAIDKPTSTIGLGRHIDYINVSAPHDLPRPDQLEMARASTMRTILSNAASAGAERILML